MFKRFLFSAGLGLAVLAAATPSYAVMEDYPAVKLQGLDKSVGRTVTFEAKVGSTIQYGPLYVKIHACRKSPPIEKPESAAFLQIWEIPPGETKSEWVFSGWMFASSPALSAMDHPVYDVWVIECQGREDLEEVAPPDDPPAAEGAAPEGEQIPVDSEAGEAPVDSEAEPEPAQEPAAETTPELAPTPAPSPQTQEQEAAPPPIRSDEIPPPAPAPQDDKGFTAYDLLKEKTQQAAPTPAPAPESAPVTQSPIY